MGRRRKNIIEKERKAKGIILILFLVSSCEALLLNRVMKTTQLHRYKATR
jgi:hypothetical protein